MFNIDVLFKVFDGKKRTIDCYDLDIKDYNNDVSCDNINQFINNNAYTEAKYAELRIRTSESSHDGFLIASFKRIKIKPKCVRTGLFDPRMISHRWVILE